MNKCATMVWSRVTGFFRPVVDWNKGKTEEFKDRKRFTAPSDTELEAKRRANSDANDTYPIL